MIIDRMTAATTSYAPRNAFGSAKIYSHYRSHISGTGSAIGGSKSTCHMHWVVRGPDWKDTTQV